MYFSHLFFLTVHVLALVNIVIAQLKIIPIFFENLTTHKLLLTWNRGRETIELNGELSVRFILYSGSCEGFIQRSSFTL